MPVGMFIAGFEIWRAGRTDDGKGGWTSGFSLSSTVEGRRSPLSSSKTPRALQERGVVGQLFSTPAATDIKAGDEVRKDGRTSRVFAVQITSRSTRKECICEEVNDG